MGWYGMFICKTLCSQSYFYFLKNLQVSYVPEGLEAIIFTADGDMRQALNNLQATYSGFRFVNQENVFKVSKAQS